MGKRGWCQDWREEEVVGREKREVGGWGAARLLVLWPLQIASLTPRSPSPDPDHSPATPVVLSATYWFFHSQIIALLP